MKRLMAANWKMFKTLEDAVNTAREIVTGTGRLPEDREVLVFPPFTALKSVGEVMAGADNYFLGGQNFYPSEQGAYTGEICPEQLLDAGAGYALVGHSERRHVQGEENGFINSKVRFGLNAGLRIILCIGETLEERRANRVDEVLRSQLEKGLSGVDRDLPADSLAVAYEPVWAIGTGEVAEPGDITEAHGLVRDSMRDLLANADEMRILYGGSVKPENCAQIISLDNVNGVLVGGASLRGDSFTRIALA
ncbi:MAG: triose-phosphate isomerase [Desulfonatronovibrionaceae bacterium]